LDLCVLMRDRSIDLILSINVKNVIYICFRIFKNKMATCIFLLSCLGVLPVGVDLSRFLALLCKIMLGIVSHVYKIQNIYMY
jgi:hypothetical protein